MKNDKQYKAVRPKAPKVDVFTVHQAGTLLAFLLEQAPKRGRGLLKAVLRDHQVFIDDVATSQFDHPLIPGNQVKVIWDREVQKKRPVPVECKIIFEDNDLLVVEKPAGLLTVATDKEKQKTVYSLLSEYVQYDNPENKIFIVHRLDRDTSGLLLLAKNYKAKQQLQETWEQTVTQRTYVGVVEGDMEPPEGTITSWLAETTAFRVYSLANGQDGKKAVTHYRKIGGNGRYSLVQINLDTSRKHQIRVHMHDKKHPIVGDKKYGARTNPLRGIALHAQVLVFTHPATGQALRFETAIPKKFLQIATEEVKERLER